MPSRIHYSLIGSILGSYPLKNAIVYGTGLMSAQRAANIRHKPRKIISVRGPRTRNALLAHGIDCPEIYGDPALLLPVFYVPASAKSNHISIVPHHASMEIPCPAISELTKKYGCRLVDMRRYDKWTDVVDSIALSQFVISESLHGLIVAETYGVPCVWVELVDHSWADDWGFKFTDFYESIGKFSMKSMKLYENFSFDDIIREKDNWKQGKINYAEMLSLLPFEIKAEFLPCVKKFLPSS